MSINSAVVLTHAFSRVSGRQEVVVLEILRLCDTARLGTTLTPAGLEKYVGVGLFESKPKQQDTKSP